MIRRISGLLGIFVIVTASLVSAVVPVIAQSDAMALGLPKIGFQQQTPLFDENNAMWSGAVSALGPDNALYEVGTLEGTVDVDPSAGVDERTIEDGTAYIRVLTSAGNYVKTRILAGVNAGSYANVRGIVFNADKSSYYLVGQFHGDVDFDMTGGETVRSPEGAGTYAGFVAKYQSSNDSLQGVQTFDGTGHSIVKNVAYSAVNDTIAISGSLFDGADPNPTGADETVTLVDASTTVAGFVSLYDANLTYDRTMVYDIGASNSTTDINDIAFNPGNGLLAAVVRMAGNGQTFNMQFDPIGGMGEQEVTLEGNQATSVIVFFDGGDYAGVQPIVLDASAEKYDYARFEVDYIDFDASGNLYYAGAVGRVDDEVPVNFDFDVFNGSGDSHALPDTYSHYVTMLTPGEGYNYNSTFFYPNPIPRDFSGENDLTGMFVDPSGNVFLSGYWYAQDGGGVFDVNPGGATDMRTVNDATTFIIQVNSDMTFGYALTNGTENSDPDQVQPYDMALVRDASGSLYATSTVWYQGLAQDADTCEMNEAWQSTIATVKFAGSGSDTSGWLDFEPSPDVYVEGCDADNDGISDADEGNVVGGDANGDDTPDREQGHVSAMTSPLTGSPVVLEVDGACTLSNVSVKSEAQTGNDVTFSYPLGLLDFTASCGTNGFTATIKQIYYDPPEGDFILRKFANGAYQTIADATITRTTLNGRNVLVVTYNVKDGGPLDVDGEENGVIVDPAGLATQIVPGAPNTGIGTGPMASVITVVSIFSFGLVVLLAVSVAMFRTTYLHK